MDNIQLKVSPQLINSKAEEAASYVEELNKSLEELNKRISNLENNWKGEAASEYFQIYKIQAVEIKNIIAEMTTHVGELKSAAKIYENADSKVSSEHNRNLPKGLLE